jgi:MFS family permease
MGIGGHYAAINSAIDEMMPSKYRGRVDIWINGTYWAGAIIGSFASLIFLNVFAINLGWRLAFLMGPVLALVVVVVARTLPAVAAHPRPRPGGGGRAGQDRGGRQALGGSSSGRSPMIFGTYLVSGTLLAVSAWLFDNGDLTATSQTFVWVVIFFFAFAGASAAYLTVSETWPIEIRSEAIAVFFTIGTVFGAMGPAFYGWLIGGGSSRTGLFIGYLVGAGIMILGGVVELLIGINAQGKSLEDVTRPLTAADG